MWKLGFLSFRDSFHWDTLKYISSLWMFNPSFSPSPFGPTWIDYSWESPGAFLCVYPGPLHKIILTNSYYRLKLKNKNYIQWRFTFQFLLPLKALLLTRTMKSNNYTLVSLWQIWQRVEDNVYILIYVFNTHTNIFAASISLHELSSWISHICQSFCIWKFSHQEKYSGALWIMSLWWEHVRVWSMPVDFQVNDTHSSSSSLRIFSQIIKEASFPELYQLKEKLTLNLWVVIPR